MYQKFSGQNGNNPSQKKRSKTTLLLLTTLVLIAGITASGCSPKVDSVTGSETAITAERSSQSTENSNSSAAKPYSIAVFIPGVIAGSPTYEMLANGVKAGAADYPGAAVHIIEGGTNQGEWESRISTIAAAGEHDLIITSNPAMPAICSAVAQKFPKQKFLIFDGFLEGNAQIMTVRYNQYEQAYAAGYFAGLVTSSSMPGANQALVIGLVAGQEYPDMMQTILPGFTDGAQAAAPGTTVDFRVVGNWYDAAKGADLARSMIERGVDIILPISGGANQGVVSAAKEAGTYIVWFDSNGYAIEPGTIVGSTAILQEKAAGLYTQKAIEGTVDFGSAVTVGFSDGWVTFIEDDPLYKKHVPEALRAAQSEMLKNLK